MMKRTLIAAGLLALSSSVFALDSLTDSQLGHTTGQDGVSLDIKTANSSLSYREMALIARPNGVATSSIISAPKYATLGEQKGAQLCQNSGTAACTAAVSPMTAVIDASGGAAPLINIGLRLPSDMQRVVVDPMSLYLGQGAALVYPNYASASNTYAPSSSVYETVRLNNPININFLNSTLSPNPISLTLQMGNKAQGSMIQVNSGRLLNLSATGIELVSLNNAVSPGTDSSIKLDLSVAASTATGFNLAGFYGDVNSNGLTLGYSGATDRADVQLNSVQAGAVGQTSSTFFSGMTNASMGSIGFTGLQVTNPSLSVKGL